MKRCVLLLSVIFFMIGMGTLPSVMADASAPRVLTFVTVRPESDPLTKWLVLIYTEACRRMKLQFKLVDVPPKRASSYSDNNIVDGELGRVADYGKSHPNMIQVPEPNNLTNFSAFVSDPTIKLDGWQSLEIKNSRVEYRRGIAECEKNLAEVVPPDRLSSVTLMPQGIKKLLLGRTDIYVDVESYVTQYLMSQEFQKFSKGKSIYNAGLMEQVSGHAFLHKKHKDLVPQLSVILRDMKAEGLFALYRDQVGLTAEDVEW